MKETMKALEALFQMKDPSIEKILRNFNYYFEANQVKALMDAYEKERMEISYDEAQDQCDIDAILKEAEERANEVWMRVKMKRALLNHGYSLVMLNEMETKTMEKIYSKVSKNL